MKQTIVILAIMLLSGICQGQTAEEWFKQKKTQRKYLIQQMAALEMYLGYARQGYTIAQNGLKTIHHLKTGEWQLHRDFFVSLNRLNPNLRNYPRIADIIALQVKIMHTYKITFKQVQQNSLFDAAETDYISRVLHTLVNSCASSIEDLTAVITANDRTMKDDERLKRINAIYRSMLDKYSYAQSLGQEAKILALQRMKEKNAIQTSRALNNLKNE